MTRKIALTIAILGVATLSLAEEIVVKTHVVHLGDSTLSSGSVGNLIHLDSAPMTNVLPDYLRVCGGPNSCYFTVYTVQEVNDRLTPIERDVQTLKDGSKPTAQLVIERILNSSALMKQLQDAARKSVEAEYKDKIDDLQKRISALERKTNGSGR